jgi:hypothetical protein
VEATYKVIKYMKGLTSLAEKSGADNTADARSDKLRYWYEYIIAVLLFTLKSGSFYKGTHVVSNTYSFGIR